VSGPTQPAIGFFLPGLHGGGAERIVLNLTQGIAERGLPVDLVLAAATGPLLDQVAPGVRLVDLASPRVLRSIGPLARYLRRERPRALVSSMSHANLVALWAARLAGTGTPVVVTEHNTMSQSAGEQGWLERNLWPPLLRGFYPWASHVVAVSRDAAEDFARTVGIARDRVQVIYNPVIMPGMKARARQTPDHPWFGGGAPPVVLGIGRLTRQKDFPTLIRAFALVRRQRPARLIILGEGEDRGALESLVTEMGLGEDVALPGFRDNPLAWLAASALFVLSSAWEGLPTVLIEALASGTRVVSTDCPSGPREILQDGRLGILVPVGDVPALSAAMVAALDCPPRPIPAAALEPFTREVAVDNYLRLVEQP
jgi:glycosyltransferase involved in cell wall biosynthesis